MYKQLKTLNHIFYNTLSNMKPLNKFQTGLATVIDGYGTIKNGKTYIDMNFYAIMFLSEIFHVKIAGTFIVFL